MRHCGPKTNSSTKLPRFPQLEVGLRVAVTLRRGSYNFSSNDLSGREQKRGRETQKHASRREKW